MLRSEFVGQRSTWVEPKSLGRSWMCSSTRCFGANLIQLVRSSVSLVKILKPPSFFFVWPDMLGHVAIVSKRWSEIECPFGYLVALNDLFSCEVVSSLTLGRNISRNIQLVQPCQEVTQPKRQMDFRWVLVWCDSRIETKSSIHCMCHVLMTCVLAKKKMLLVILMRLKDRTEWKHSEIF